MCSTYEEKLQVKEAKDNQLVYQYELFRMKVDEDIFKVSNSCICPSGFE